MAAIVDVFDPRPCIVCRNMGDEEVVARFGGTLEYVSRHTPWMVELVSARCRRCGSRLLRPLPGPQTDFLASPATVALFGGAAGGGKAIHTQEVVPTPSGWTTMGELKAGDHVFDEHGRVVEVLVAHEIFTAPAYEVTFACGSVLTACGDHRWLTFDERERSAMSRRSEEFKAKRRASRPSRARPDTSEARMTALAAHNKLVGEKAAKGMPTGTVRTTREIYETMRSRRGALNHAVPVAGALQLPERELAVRPYLLGIWLGNLPADFKLKDALLGKPA